MPKSGVEYLAQHPGWKTKKHKPKRYRYSDGNTFTDNLTLAEARRFKKLQNGGTITPMPKAKVEHLDNSDVATILAALRLFQREYEDMDAIKVAEAWPEHFEATNPEDVRPAPLGTRDISTLCERINCAKCLVLP